MGYSCPVDVVGLVEQTECVTGVLDYLVQRHWITVGIMDGLADPPGATAGLTGLCDGELVPRPACRAFARYVNAPGGLPAEESKPPRIAYPKGEQLAQNPGFEKREAGDFISWIPWGDRMAGRAQTALQQDLNAEPYQGEAAAMAVTEERAFHGGLYQVLEVPAGTWLAGTVRTRVSFTKVPPKARIGIDPEGGTSPDTESITWSPWYSPHDPDAGWVEIGLEYPVRVEGERGTVFLEWFQPVAAGRSAVGFDEVYAGAVER
jgi:hypothetical protein